MDVYQASSEKIRGIKLHHHTATRWFRMGTSILDKPGKQVNVCCHDFCKGHRAASTDTEHDSK